MSNKRRPLIDSHDPFERLGGWVIVLFVGAILVSLVGSVGVVVIHNFKAGVGWGLLTLVILPCAFVPSRKRRREMRSEAEFRARLERGAAVDRGSMRSSADISRRLHHLSVYQAPSSKPPPGRPE